MFSCGCIIDDLEAFTLLELLIIVGIIAFLSSLILPSIARSRVAADSVVCKNNLHQYGIALHLYLDDCKGYPTDLQISTDALKVDGLSWYDRLGWYAGAPWPRWQEASKRYEPDHGVAICPAYARLPNATYGPSRNFISDRDSTRYGSYAYNGGMEHLGLIRGPWVSDVFVTYSFAPPIRDNEVLKPCDMIAIGDAQLAYGAWTPDPTKTKYTTGLDYYDLTIGGYSIIMRIQIDPTAAANAANLSHFASVAMMKRRHGGRFNILFCDGHVVGMRVPELFDMRQPSIARRWYRDNQSHPEWHW